MTGINQRLDMVPFIRFPYGPICSSDNLLYFLVLAVMLVSWTKLSKGATLVLSFPSSSLPHIMAPK